MNRDGKMKEVLFDLASDALYVANGGRPFTRKGVIGICASHLSEKTDVDSDNYGAKDEDLISKIQEREIRTYENDGNRLTSDSRAEQEISHDYGGRFVWELLQNVDDVMGSERGSADLIGSKGLGFKSVLEITQEPEIHSDPFHFRFSPSETQRLLKEKGISDNPPRLRFRIPHDCGPDEKIRELQKSAYSTVIRLPFQNETARNTAKDILENLEPYFLLLSQELEGVRIILDGEEKHFRIERETHGFSDGKAVLHSPDGKTNWRCWREAKEDAGAKRLTIAIALPIDENGKEVPHTAELPLHVFFPTEEQPGVKALIHASFELEQNRKHLRDGDHDKEILNLFGDVVERAIKDVPAQTALETFGPIAPGDQSGRRLLGKIQQTIREKMRTTPFVPIIGGGKVAPCESTVWENDLGKVLRTDEQEVKDAALVRPRLCDLFKGLRKLGAKEIEDSEYVWLLRYCHNNSLEACIRSFRVLKGCLEAALSNPDARRKIYAVDFVPCFWTESEQARPLATKPPLLWEKPEDWPEWLPADSLHPTFRTKIEEENKDYLDRVLIPTVKLPRNNKDYLDWVLIPTVKKWTQQHWKRQGFDVLEVLARWEGGHDFSKITPWIEDEVGCRNTLAPALHLPTDKGWQSAINCFAGKDWEGPGAFEEFFKKQETLGIVQAFEEWPKSLQQIAKEKWKGLLRWIGVSWEPKVYRTQEFIIDGHDLWENYSSDNYHTPGRPGKNYAIRDFPDCVQNIEKTKLMLDVFPILLKLSEKNAERFHRSKSLSTSFALHQLIYEAWLPVKKSLLEDRARIPPNEAFLPGKGLGGLLPEVDRSGIDNDTWYGNDGIASKLRELGVMDSLPGDANKWHDWMRSLAEKTSTLPQEEREAPSDWKDDGAKSLWQAARSLYREYLNRDISDPFPDNIKIPCVCLENGRRMLHLSWPQELHWIDEPHLMDSSLEQELLKRGYKLFLFRLKDGEQAERLGVKKLSSMIECRPHYQRSGDHKTDALRQRYARRRIVLERVWKIELPKTIALKAVTALELKLSANDQGLGSCPVLSWKEQETDSILVDIQKKQWRALAHALAHHLYDGKYLELRNDFEVYLSDNDDTSVLDRARDAGVPEEALEEMETSFQQSQANGQSEERTAAEDEDWPTEDIYGAPDAADCTDPSPEVAEEMDQRTSNRRVDEARRPLFSNRSRTPRKRMAENSGGSPNGRRSNGRGVHHQERLNDEARLDGPHPESGQEAERWFEGRLCERWPSDIEKVHTGRDFTLSVRGRTVHIEAKHVDNLPGSIHWSDRQYECAEETSRNSDSYFIAVLSPDQSDKYAVHWIWDPLEELKALERIVTWSGKSEAERLQANIWNMDALKPQNVPSSNFSIEVKLTDAIFHPQNKDGPQLERLKEKIEEDM